MDLFLPDGDGSQLIDEVAEHVPIVILLVAEPPLRVRPRVRACLIKSEASEPAIIAQILSASGAPTPRCSEGDVERVAALGQ